MLTFSQRFLFWAQAPIAVIFGTAVYYSIPRSFSSRNGKGGTITSKLGEIDYLGAVTLVSISVLLVLLMFFAKNSDLIHLSIFVWPFFDYDTLAAHSNIYHYTG
jgi:hypothetical protein